MAKLVLYTFGILQQPRDHEQINGFHDRNPFVYTSAENSVGFVDRSGLAPSARVGVSSSGIHQATNAGQSG